MILTIHSSVNDARMVNSISKLLHYCMVILARESLASSSASSSFHLGHSLIIPLQRCRP